MNFFLDLVLILKWRNSDLVNVASNILTRDIADGREYYISFHDPARLSNPYLEGFAVRDYVQYKVKVSQVS